MLTVHIFVKYKPHNFVTLIKYCIANPEENEDNAGKSGIVKDMSKVFKTSMSMIETSAEVNQLKTSSRVFFESYCENVYTAKESEKLLAIDSRYAQEWWRPLNFPLMKKIANPLCSPYPNLLRGTKETINKHEFFLQKNILIPSKTGDVEIRLHHFDYHNQPPTWRQFLDCDCEPFDNMYPLDKLCQGRKIILSRGVGGDTSFFIHEKNTKGQYIVVAHICFPQDNFKEPSKCRSLCRYVGAGSKRIISTLNTSWETKNSKDRTQEKKN